MKKAFSKFLSEGLLPYLCFSYFIFAFFYFAPMAITKAYIGESAAQATHYTYIHAISEDRLMVSDPQSFASLLPEPPHQLLPNQDSTESSSRSKLALIPSVYRKPYLIAQRRAYIRGPPSA